MKTMHESAAALYPSALAATLAVASASASAASGLDGLKVRTPALVTGLVAEAVALGVPDERLGQAVHLIARAAPDVLDAEIDLPRILQKELPNFMQPKVIHWRMTMPIGPNGKIDRAGLLEDLTA